MNQILNEEEMQRVKDLQANENVLYTLLEYLIDLWGIDENKEEMIEHFKSIGLTKEDIQRLQIEYIYFQ